MGSTPFTLPSDFLTGPSPNLTIAQIDFPKRGLPDYKGLYAALIDNAFTASECASLVRAAEARTDGTWEQAMINVGGGRQMVITDARNCGRIIWDDAEVVERIWKRIRGAVPEVEVLKNCPKILGSGPVKWGETWRMTRLNERMRFLKYGEGEYFRPHMDGSYVTPDGQEKSFMTLHLYLNDAESSPESEKLEGEATAFHSYNMRKQFDVMPKIGRVLIFQHRELLHSGADVMSGIKMTLRTDLMYKRDDKDEEEE